MEENTKVDKEVIEKDKDTLVVDEDNRIIDFDTILSENKDDSVVNNINNLLACGSNYVSREVIKERFAEKTGSMVNEKIAMNVLKEIFDEFVELINTKDEFVMVSGKDGKIDKAGTEKKLRENADYIIHNKNEEENITKILGINKEEKKNEADSIFKTPEHIERKRVQIEKALEKIELSKEEIEKRNNTEVTEEKVGSNLYKLFNDSLEVVSKYTKKELQLIDYCIQLEEAKGTKRYDKIVEERNKFIRENPEIEHLLDKGILKEEHHAAKEEVLIFGVALELSTIKEIGIENLDENSRQNAIKNMIAGLDVECIREEVTEALIELIPGYMDINKISKEKRKEIEEKEKKPLEGINRKKIEEALGIENPLFEEGFEILKKSVSRNLIQHVIDNVDIKRIRQNNGRISKEDTDKWFEINSVELTADSIEKSSLTPEMRYFRGSNIPFSKDDEEFLKKAYQITTVETWINSKNKMLAYRYAHLLKSKAELESLDDVSSIAIARLYKIEADIEEMQKKYPNIENNLPKKSTLDKYSEYKVISKISSEFIKDEENINSYDDYNKLSDQEKKIYLRNTIVSLNLNSNSKNPESNKSKSMGAITKLGLRRLEILNNSQRQFINENGEVNTDAIFEEYMSLSRHKFKDYQELSDFCEMNKLEYVNDKLEEYADLPESSFKLLRDFGDTQEMVLEKIENEKARKWNDDKFIGSISDTISGKKDSFEVSKLELPTELKDRVTKLEEYINGEDKKIMEFQMLQKEIESAYGNDQKDAIKRRDELIRKNPDKKTEFLKLVEKPVQSIMRLEKYNNAVVEKNALLTIGTINKLPKESLKYLIDSKDTKAKDLKEKVLLTLIASLDGILEDYQPEVISTIQKICPNAKLIDEKTGKMISDFEKISPMLGNELGIENCDMFTISRLMYNAKNKILQNEIDSVDEKNGDSNLSLESLSKLSNAFSKTTDVSELTQNREQKYFKNSKYKYTENDIQEFDDLYCKTLSGSWIEEKETAEKYRYILLLNQDEERKKNTLITERGHLQFEKNLKDFEEKHPNLKREDFIENGVLNQEAKKEISKYASMKYAGDLMSDYVIDEDKVESPEDYQNLSEKEKRIYIYKSVLGLLEVNKENPIINKLATRRLEIISTPEKNFIKEGENFEVNKETVFNEFRELFNLKDKKNIELNSFDDFEKIYKNRKLLHVKSRLKRYDEYTEENEFLKLISTDDRGKAQEIQKYKANNALKRALGATEYRIINSNKWKEKLSEDTRNVKSEKSDNLTEKSQRVESKNDEFTVPEKSISGNESSLGIKLEDINVDESHSQEISPDMQPQELVQDGQEESIEQPKLSFVDRIKNAISNFRKPIEENTEELALVENKGGFFDNIKNAMKNIFGKSEDKIEESHKQEETKLPNVFDQRYKVNVDTRKVADKHSDNKTLQESNRETEEDKDGVSYGE